MLDSLHHRARAARLLQVLDAATAGRVDRRAAERGIKAEALAATSDLVAALRAYEPPLYPRDIGTIRSALVARFAEDDAKLVLAAAEPGWRARHDALDLARREYLLLNLAAYYDVQPALSRTGLTSHQPPSDVHTMARGPEAGAGATWFADLVVDAAERAGAPLRPAGRVLDFGCSSCRVLRVLAAWRDDVEWVGCDPNVTATAWADAALPGLHAFASPQEPPLALEDASVDLAYAISVWSHFGAAQAVRWLAEMHRVLKPGAALVLTTQGLPSLAYYLRHGSIGPHDARSAAHDLLVRGHHYVEAFGEEGDWGVSHPEWGMAYLTPDWLAQQTSPAWSLGLLEPARNEGNQDLIVLIRR